MFKIIVLKNNQKRRVFLTPHPHRLKELINQQKKLDVFLTLHQIAQQRLRPNRTIGGLKIFVSCRR